MADKIEKIIADTFLQMAEGLETGNFGKKPRIALTGMGSEHGEENAMEAAKMAAKDRIDVYYIGTLEADGVTTVKVADDEEGHKKMEEMLASHEVDGAVTMHFPFPIGVSTVGRVVTPAKGREMFIANTTGTSSSDRIEGMIKNTIYGIIAAKACGKEHPTVGILNVDGARQTEMALKELEKNGYDITFAESARADGGCVMRGNDVLQGTPADILWKSTQKIIAASKRYRGAGRLTNESALLSYAKNVTADAEESQVQRTEVVEGFLMEHIQ